jgi:nicotinamidase-related amidase
VGKGTGAPPKSKSVADVRHKSSPVVLFIDAINHFEFPDGASLLRQSLQIAPNLVRLKERAYRAKVPVVYVNDNLGQWRSERSRLIEYCLRPESPGREFVRQVAPTDEDYFVLKPMHSAFYQTPLDVLLRYFEASTLILCGISTNSAALFARRTMARCETLSSSSPPIVVQQGIRPSTLPL